MRTPSDRLVEILTDQKLCSKAELMHCEPYVRRLCHDLPDFDSVWLDALVQQRFLTAWQADHLQTDAADAITIGRYQRQRALGRSTYLATDEKRRQQFVLRQLPGSTVGSIEQGLDELLSTVDRFRSTLPAALNLPQEAITNQEVITNNVSRRSESLASGPSTAKRYLVSNFVTGWSMEELLIRGQPFA